MCDLRNDDEPPVWQPAGDCLGPALVADGVALAPDHQHRCPDPGEFFLNAVPQKIACGLEQATQAALAIVTSRDGSQRAWIVRRVLTPTHELPEPGPFRYAITGGAVR